MVKAFSWRLVDEVSRTYNTKSTHLIVGPLVKTDKFLCGLAASIPMVDVGYKKQHIK